eukprot:s6042_g4.t1
MVNFRDRWNTPKQAAAAADQPPLLIDQSQGRVTAGPSWLQPAAVGPSAACETASASLLETIPGRAASPAPAESVLPQPLSALPVLEPSAEGSIPTCKTSPSSLPVVVPVRTVSPGTDDGVVHEPLSSASASAGLGGSEAAGARCVLASGRPLPPPPPPARRKRKLEVVDVASSESTSTVPGDFNELSYKEAEAFMSTLEGRDECPGGHLLVRFGTPLAGWWCSSCTQVFATQRLMWGCRICNFDVCGKCLLHMRAFVLPPGAPQGSTSSVPMDDQGQSSSVLAGRALSAPAAPSRVRVTVSAAHGVMCSEDVFPFFLELTCRIGDAVLTIAATSPGAEFRGGFRRVYLLSGHEAVENLVLKLGKSLEDNVNELRAASLCPSAFSEVAASGSIQISLQPNTLLDAHYILAEKVVPVTEVLQLDLYPSADARALLGYKCMRALCNASLCGVKCRDLGVLQWDLRGTLSAGAMTLRRPGVLLKGLQDEALQIVVLDANCCVPTTGSCSSAAPMLGPRRMKSFWSFMLRLCSAQAVAGLQALVTEHGHDPRVILARLTLHHLKV